MAKGVTKIEECASVLFGLFFFISGHNGGFENTGTANRLGECGRVSAQDIAAVVFTPGKKVWICDQTGLHNFGITGNPLSTG